MRTFIKNTLASLFPVLTLQLRAYRLLIANKKSYLYTTGWMQSLRERKPIDSNEEPIPWMNFPIIQFLDERLTSNLSLFEFGSGYSTFFYASRVQTVTSLEYDQKWLDVIKLQAPQNVTLLFQEKDIDGDYCRAISSTQKQYDVVIVDGRDRVNCVKQSIAFLSPSGVVILDDSQRGYYQEGIDFAKAHGFKALHFVGLKATGAETDRTTIFYRQENCFGI
jgi:hypothetical protein